MLATVKGDVHDIGKNLVDIILTNNGYRRGQPRHQAAGLRRSCRPPRSTDADVIGMSGLLVKSTVVMKENLEEMNQRGVATRWPVLLGGAALTRAYVEQDLADVFDGEVRYARDAFEGLRLMDAIVAVKRRAVPARCAEVLPARRVRQVRHASRGSNRSRQAPVAPTSPPTTPCPTPPFWGTRVVKGIALADYAAWLDERATFMGQWGLKSSRAARRAQL